MDFAAENWLGENSDTGVSTKKHNWMSHAGDKSCVYMQKGLPIPSDLLSLGSQRAWINRLAEGAVVHCLIDLTCLMPCCVIIGQVCWDNARCAAELLCPAQ